MNDQLSKDLNSYVSFALKQRPSVSFPGRFDEKGKFIDKPARVRLDEFDALSSTELSSIESLLNKFNILRPYLRPNATLDSLKIVPKEYVEPKSDPDKGVEYRKMTVHAGQLEVAKKISRMVDDIYQAHSNGKSREAKEKYYEFNAYLADKRKELVGDFRTASEVEDSLALYGVGLNHFDNGGAVIFVIIEVVVACPLVDNVFEEKRIL